MLKQAQTRKTSDQVPCGICYFCSSLCIYHTDIYKSFTQYFCVVPHFLVSQSIRTLIEQDILCTLRNTSVFLPNYMTQLSSLHVWSINIERSKVDKWKALTKQGFFLGKPWFQILINIYIEFLISIDYGRMANLQLLCIALPATHANDFHVSLILWSFCTRNNVPPMCECLSSVLPAEQVERKGCLS